MENFRADTAETAPSNSAGKRHAVLVLGSAVLKSGAPSPALKRRVRAGVRLHTALENSVLIVSGGIGRHGPSEASIMRDVALAEGAADPHILLEENSLNTRENINNTRNMSSFPTGARLHVVTDAYHVPRCRLYLRLAGIPAVCHPVPGVLRDEGAAKTAYYILREAVGLLKYGWLGVSDRFR